MRNSSNQQQRLWRHPSFFYLLGWASRPRWLHCVWQYVWIPTYNDGFYGVCTIIGGWGGGCACWRKRKTVVSQQTHNWTTNVQYGAVVTRSKFFNILTTNDPIACPRRQCLLRIELIEAKRCIYASVNWSSLVQIMVCRLAGAKSSSEPMMLEYCVLVP